jgi:hypothetical protein
VPQRQEVVPPAGGGAYPSACAPSYQRTTNCMDAPAPGWRHREGKIAGVRITSPEK